MRHSARDLANLADGLTGVQIAEAFLTAASPGVIALFLENQLLSLDMSYRPFWMKVSQSRTGQVILRRNKTLSDRQALK